MKVSVVMPVFNSELYLAGAIESILGQTLREFEFIILDDGSTDGSPEICKRYAAADSRVKYHRFDHQGYSPLLNKGVQLATTNYIARMDSDDIAMKRRLELQVAFMETNTDHVAVGCQAIRIDNEGHHLGPMPMPLQHAAIDSSQIDKGRGVILHPGSLISKAALDRIGGYRPEFEPGEDFDLFLRLAEVGKLANLPEFLMHYRVHFKNVTVTRKEHHRLVKQNAIAEAYQRRGLTQPVPTIRLNDSPPTEAANHFLWMHMALTAGYFQTARKHAWKGFAKSHKKPHDVYDFLQGMLGILTRTLKSWKNS